LARTEKPMIAALKPSASVTSDSEMPPTPACRMRAATSSVPSFLQRSQNGFERALHVGFHDQREFLAARGLELRHHLLERAAHAGNRGGGVLALLVGAIARDLAGAGFVLDHRKAVAGFRRAVEAEHFDRHRRSGLVEVLALVRNQRADAAHFGAGHDDVADLERAALHQHGGDRTAAAIELGFDHGAFGGRSELVLRSSSSACSAIISSSLSRLVLFLADTSTSTTSPPNDST
jgi:hypothetical protein